VLCRKLKEGTDTENFYAIAVTYEALHEDDRESINQRQRELLSAAEK